MKFTSEDLMKAMGLKVGDRVKVREKIYPIIRQGEYICYQDDEKYLHLIAGLVDEEIEILPQPKRVGDLKCENFDCINCPLRILIDCNKLDNQKRILFEILEEFNEDYISFDQEIYGILKARLDKEVNDNDSKSI